MMAGDLLHRLWWLVLAYPALAFMLVALLWLAGTLIALALLSMLRPELPLRQREDDDDQHRAVSRRMPLP